MAGENFNLENKNFLKRESPTLSIVIQNIHFVLTKGLSIETVQARKLNISFEHHRQSVRQWIIRSPATYFCYENMNLILHEINMSLHKK